MQIAGREVQITNPDKVFFPVAGYTKGDLLDYYLAVAEGAVRAVSNRPMALKRFVQGADGEAFFQKRAPANRPPWIETAVLSFPSGRTAEEIVVRDAAQLAWVVNLGCIDLNPPPVRSDDLDHPDEFRIDLDPMVKPESSARYAQMYLSGSDTRTPLGSPLYANLKGLPPLLIIVGTSEVLLDDSTRFAKKAKEEGVSCELEVWEEMVHIWPFFAELPEARQAIDRMAAFIGKHAVAGR